MNLGNVGFAGALLLFGVFSFSVSAALPELTPLPQGIKWTDGHDIWLEAHALRGVATDASLPADLAALELLASALKTPLAASDNGNLKLVLSSLPDAIPARTRHEAYQLVVDAAGATITAETAHGIHNGLISLKGLIDAEKGIPCVSITDWPDQQMRGTYVSGIAQAEERFDQFVDLKLNLLLLEDDTLYDLDNPEICARHQKLAEACRANFIEFVPELQSLGWGHFVLQREPRAVEARLAQRAAFSVRDGRVFSPDLPLPASVEVTNPSFAAGLDGWTAETYYQRWNPATSEEAQVMSVDGDAGNQALRLSLSQLGTVRVAQEVTVQPNARYTAQCRIKTQDVTGVGALIEVYGIDKNGAMTHIGPNSTRVTGTSDWQVNEAVFETGADQRARPGGTLEDEAAAIPREGFERVRIYVRLQDATGTAWFDAVEVVPIQSPNPLANVVVTEHAKVVVENESGDTVYEEGRDYTLDVPELVYPYAMGEPLQVVLTEDSRIKDGDTLLLTFNQATLEDITCCPSEPLYDEFMRKSIANVVEKLNPNYLHIGHDEPRFFNRDQRCVDRNLSNEALFADAIKRIHASAKAANPNMRLMLWDDAINPYQNGPHLNTSDVAKLLPRDIIINVWWYDNHDMEDQMDKSVAFFMELGFDVTGSPWFRIPNTYHWAQLFDAHKDAPKALGIIYTSWGEVPEPWGALEFTAEHTWSFGKPEYTP